MSQLKPELKFNLQLKRVLSDVRKNTDAEVHSWGTDAVAIAKRLAPKKTGAMAESIHLESGQALGMQVNRKVKESKPGAHQEFGTAHNRANPHLIPACIIAKDNAKERIHGRGLV